MSASLKGHHPCGLSFVSLAGEATHYSHLDSFLKFFSAVSANDSTDAILSERVLDCIRARWWILKLVVTGDLQSANRSWIIRHSLLLSGLDALGKVSVGTACSWTSNCAAS